MTIKKLSFAVIAGLALATSSVANYADGHKEMKAKKMQVQKENALDKVQLTPEQTSSIQTIKDAYEPQLDALKDAKKLLKEQHAALDPNSPDYAEQSQVLEGQIDQIKTERAILKQQMKEETKQVLTPEQRMTIEPKIPATPETTIEK